MPKLLCAAGVLLSLHAYALPSNLGKINNFYGICQQVLGPQRAHDLFDSWTVREVEDFFYEIRWVGSLQGMQGEGRKQQPGTWQQIREGFENAIAAAQIRGEQVKQPGTYFMSHTALTELNPGKTVGAILFNYNEGAVNIRKIYSRLTRKDLRASLSNGLRFELKVGFYPRVEAAKIQLGRNSQFVLTSGVLPMEFNEISIRYFKHFYRGKFDVEKELEASRQLECLRELNAAS